MVIVWEVAMGCKSCGLEHSPQIRCETARAVAVVANMANGGMANSGMAGDVANVANSSTYRYRDEEKRREYQREYMRRKRMR